MTKGRCIHDVSGPWRVSLHELVRTTQADTDVQDITDDVAAIVSRSGVAHGSVLVHTPGATASVSTLEYESGAIADLKRAIDALAPTDGEYAHNARWGDGNGYSHVRSALLGPGITVPVAQGRLLLGTWQQIVLLDFDNRPRERRVVVQVSGVGGA